MTYTTGSGTVILDFMTALNDFATAIGWAVIDFDTTNNRLYISNGICNVCLGWVENDITDYSSGSPVAIAEQLVYGTLCKTIGSGTDFWDFDGATPGAADVTDGGNVVMSYMQGPYNNWWFFSDAGATYIHCVVQVSADRYRRIIMGTGNNNGLSHSGCAYLASDGGDPWYQSRSDDNAYLQPIFFSCFSLRLFAPSQGRFNGRNLGNCSSMVLYSVDALPSPFVNEIGFPTSVRNNSGAQYAMSLTADAYANATSYPGGDHANCFLLDYITGMQGPEWAAAVPMAGLPLGVITGDGTASCIFGTIPDFRLIDLTNLSPQQNISVGSDTWQVFPLMRQQAWDVSGGPTSGQRGIALKVIM